MTQEKFEKRFKTLDFSKTKDAWGNEIYAHSHIQAKWEGWDAALTQPSICKDGLPKLTQENPYVTQPKADVEGLKDMIGEATSIFEHIVDDLRDNQDLSHKDFRIKVSEMAHDYLSQNHIRHLAAQGYIGGGEGWQDISTIPDNLMSDVDLWDDREEKRYINCTFDLRAQAWADEKYDFVKIPTHWMPLPAAPKKEG